MSNRYILDPSGKIFKVNSVSAGTTQPEVINSTIVKGIHDENVGKDTQTYIKNLRDTSAFSTDDYVGDGFSSTFFAENLDYNNKNSVLYKQSANKSHDFGRSNLKDTNSFRGFNSYIDLEEEGSDSDIIPFADESEIMAGFRFDKEEISAKEIKFLFSYLIGVVVQAAIAESIIGISEGLRNNNNLEQKFELVLGEYTYTEYDIFNKYLLNQINYPSGTKFNFSEKIAAYFVGLNEFFAGDDVFSFPSFFKETGILDSLTLDVLIEITLRAILNQAGNKRLILVVKKFNTQRYWLNETLYSAKRKDEVSSFFNETNYYFFKFFVERVHVGIKIINRRIKNNVNNQIGTEINKYNRTSGFRLHHSKSNATTFASNNASEIISNALSPVLNFLKPGSESVNTDPIKKLLDNLSKEDLNDYYYKWRAESNSKKGRGLNLSSLPQVFMMSHDYLKTSSFKNDDSILETSKNVSQNFIITNNRKAPIELVNRIESELELEYVPFYFHDLRTNELVSLHAFVESVSDSYSPDYVQTDGFGRIDSVRTYSKTTRSISMSFFIAALSPEDHDLMWYQINKLVSMCYPQWSKGFDMKTNINGKDFDFTYPFSQVITNSPLIRIRLGDVIKSNYSRKSLSRIFGLTNNNDVKKITDNMLIDKSEFKYYLRPGLYQKHKNALETIFVVSDNIKIDQEISVELIKKDIFGVQLQPLERKKYIEKVKSGEEIIAKISKDDKELYLYVDPNSIIEKEVVGFKEQLENQDPQKNLKIKTFMNSSSSFNSDSVFNPITNSYESGMSKGLAGHITNLDLNYQDMTWETSRIGSKAPLMAKITIQFAPIHDIPPGIDHNGVLRAANYNVGSLNNSMFEDPVNNDNDYAMNKYKQHILEEK